MIELRALRKRFGRQPLLEGVHLQVEPGAMVAITGASGAGKTTLLRLVAGLERPDGGEILLDGRLVSSPRRLVPPHRRGVGLAMQHPALWPHMTVREHLAFVLGGLPRREVESRIHEQLEALELETLADRRTGELSGGEARRLSLARSLAPRPRVLLLDEPLAHLDPGLRDTALGHLVATARREGMTVLLVSHRQEDLRGIAHELLRLEGGRLGPDPPSLQDPEAPRWEPP